MFNMTELLAIDFGSSLFLNLGLLIVVGVFGGILAEKVRLPRVTGYIIAGILIGPDVIGLIPKEFIYEMKGLKILTMGFVGFNIGMEVKLNFLKHHGWKILIITLLQAFIVFVVVFTMVYIVASEHKITYALVLASIATVTTPAPIVACMRSYKTKGELSDLICPIVAIDDIIGIVLFTLLLPLGIYFAGHEGEVIQVMDIVIGPFFSIIICILIGFGLGFITRFTVKHYSRSDNISLELIIATSIIIGVGIGELIGVSDILIPLVIGAVISNTLKPTLADRIKSNTDVIVLPLLLIFFTLSGADLRIDSIELIGLLSIVYVVFRILAKVYGTRIAARVAGESKKASKYLGFMMIPQGGVALDMAILAELRFIQIATDEGLTEFEAIGTTIFTVVLFAIIIYKIIGEVVVKRAFKMSGEITDNHDDHIPHVI